MRDPLIRKSDAWADFLNGIFLRKVWREPIVAENLSDTATPALPPEDPTSLRVYSPSKLRGSAWPEGVISAHLSSTIEALWGKSSLQDLTHGSGNFVLASPLVGGPPCAECGMPSRQRYCSVCTDRNRDRRDVLVVDTEEAIQEAQDYGFKGVFHWLREQDSRDGLVRRLRENDARARFDLRKDRWRTEDLIQTFNELGIEASAWNPKVTPPNGAPASRRAPDSGGASSSI